MTNENDKLIGSIKSPQDLRSLDIAQLERLAGEIRELISSTVGKNGGHLASNLGVVELTIAMHYVFDFASDRLLWDVGHQCYVHKILTGRADKFAQLRQQDGLSGFPDPAESHYDQFVVGHAGTAVATAIGLALGAKLKQTDEKVVAVVGDASIVNGLSFEGLNNLSLLDRQLLIILNDNSMAIDKTQGTLARYLTGARLSGSYGDLHRRTKLLVKRLPYFGSTVQEAIHRLKGGLKTTLQGGMLFEQLGVPYFGPVDGHDMASLIELLKSLKNLENPILLHVQTEKGRGFAPAIADPCRFHSPQPFKLNGQTASFDKKPGKSFTAVFADTLGGLMDKDEKIVALTAAMADGTGLASLRDRFDERIIDVGIAESAAVDIAAGLAKRGLKPVVAIYSTFLQRCFDQIFQEVALQALPVIFCIDRAGLVGGDGAVHHGFCDISLLRVLPNIVLMAPMDAAEFDSAMKFAIRSGRPCAIRYPRDRVPETDRIIESAGHLEPFELGISALLRDGTDAVVLAYGTVAFDAILAAQSLADENIDTAVVSTRFAKPLDEKLLHKLLTPHCDTPIIIVEDHSLIGGFGSAVLEFAQKHSLDSSGIRQLGLPDRFIRHGSRSDQLASVGLDPAGIATAVRQAVNRQGPTPNSGDKINTPIKGIRAGL